MSENPIAPVMQRTDIQVQAGMDSQVITAKTFPRNETQCIDKIINLLAEDSELASACYYTLPARKGQDKGIQGPSVRLAEVFIYLWGNIKAGTRIISNDGRQVIVEGWAWDLEKNLEVSSQVVKSIVTSRGETYSPTMQATTIAAASSIAYRNAIFKIIPFMFVEKVYRIAQEKAVSMLTRNKEGAEEEQRRFKEKVFSSLAKYDIKPMQVLGYFQRATIDEITAEDMKEIIGIGQSLRDGFILPEEAFVRSAAISHDRDGVVVPGKSLAESLADE
jgi:hypothetical protein